MGSFSSLNTYSSLDVVLTVDDVVISSREGGNILMKLMAWTPIHDIGDPFNTQGVQITHTFQPANIVMSNGTTLTPEQYANTVVNHPTTAAIGFVTVVDTPVKFNTQSISFPGPFGGTPYSHEAAVQVNMTTSAYDISGDFCFECWHNPVLLAYDTPYIMTYGGDIQTSSVPQLALAYRNSSRLEIILCIDGEFLVTPILSPTTKELFYNVWHHFAIVRSSGLVRLFLDGELLGSPVASSTNFSHAADYVRIGCASTTADWAGPFPIYGYIDSARFSNVARYTSTGSITVPTTAWTTDANTVFLLGAIDDIIIDQANVYALNRVMAAPNDFIRLRGGSPNVSMTNTATNTWQVKYIHTPEDYLAGDTYLDYPRDYSGIGNPDVPATLDWVTNIKNLSVAVYDYTYGVHLVVENFSEVTNQILGDLPYNYYGATPAEYTGILTNFNDSTQTTQITDKENSDRDIYTVSITTQHHPSLVVIDTTESANLTKTWGYANNVPGANGQVTLTGTKTNLNQALKHLTFVKNDYVPGSLNSDRPNQRNAVAKLLSVTQTWPPQTVPAVFYPSTITTNQLATPPRPGIPYCTIPNDQTSAVATGQSLNLIIPNLGTAASNIGTDASWTGCKWNDFSNYTHEFWIYIDDAAKNCNIHVGDISLSLYESKLWMAWSVAIPGIGGVADTASAKPRRIEYNSVVSSGTWYHIAQVKNDSVYKFYVNGVNDTTVYTGGDTTTVVASNATGFTPTVTDYWRYCGYTPMLSVNETTATTYKLPGFAGKLAQVRVSRTARYTGNFTPPVTLFINDSTTIYLHQFNVVLAQDDSTLPVMTPGAKKLTWTITNPLSSVIANLTQNYYPILRNPVFTAGDINFQSTDENQSRIAYAGTDIDNNPIFVYGFRSDTDQLAILVNKIENSTGQVIIGPTVNMANLAGFYSSIPVQCISEFEQGGYDLLDNANSCNVYIGTQFNSNAALLIKANLNQEYTEPTLSGVPVVITSQANISVPVVANFNNYSLGLVQTSTTRNGLGGNVLLPSSITTNGANSLIAYANVSSTVTNSNSTKYKRGISIVGFVPVQPSTPDWSATQYKAPQMSFALNGGTGNLPYYEFQIGYNTATTATTGTNFMAGGGGSNLQGRLQAISLNSKQGTLPTIYGNNKFLVMLRRRILPDTTGEYIQLQVQAGQIYQNIGPATPVPSSVVLGTDQYLLTRPGQTVFPFRVGAYACVSGSAPDRAWMLYTQDITTTGNATTGVSTGTSKGLWYRRINLDASNNITWGVPVQVTDPAGGAIYGRDIVASSISIGAWTYIYAIVAGPAQSQTTTPYIVSLRIPN